MTKEEKDFIEMYHMCDDDLQKIASSPLVKDKPDGWVDRCIAYLKGDKDRSRVIGNIYYRFYKTLRDFGYDIVATDKNAGLGDAVFAFEDCLEFYFSDQIDKFTKYRKENKNKL